MTNRKLKRMVPVLLSLLFMLSIIPWISAAPVYADTTDVHYVDGTGRDMGTKKCEVLYNNYQTTLNDGWYASWNWETVFDSRVTVAPGATVNLILDKGTTLRLNKGIEVPGSAKLIIWGAEARSGTLIAYSDRDHGDAAIGGGYRSGKHDSGQIIINSGRVSATSFRTGAAIGGGTDGTGNVTINGGEVHATLEDNTMTIDGLVRHNSGAAIGSGWYKGSANVTINGGDVTATSKSPAGCAIGTANKGWADEYGRANIVINGGTVHAYATAGAPAIGGLWGGGKRGTLTVNGGMVYAEGSPGIGGNMDSFFTYVDGNPQTEITANSYGGNVTLGMEFHEGDEYFQKGAVTNEMIADKTIIPHKDHTYEKHAAKAPSYDAESGTYVNGNIEYYTCRDCGQTFLKDGNTYRYAAEQEFLVPYFEFVLDAEGKAVLTGYNGQDADIVIPDTVPDNYPDAALRGKAVETIKESAFYENGLIRTVTAGNSIKTIEKSAFQGCPNLETASFGDGIEYIGGSAFYSCGNLTRLEIRSRKSNVINGLEAFLFSDKLAIYGYHDTGVQKMARWESVPFYCLDSHEKSIEWVWSSTDAGDGIPEATVIFSCPNCDLRAEVQAHIEVLQSATCTTDGSARYSASFTDDQGIIWNAQEERVITALGHKIIVVQDYSNGSHATCTTAGSYDMVHRCERCGLETGRRSGITERALGHIYKTAPETAVPATCTQPGRAAGKMCTRCGDVQPGAVTSPLGHDWSSWAITKEATETTEGEKTRYCSRCDEVETTVIPVLAHVHRVSKVEEKAVTCFVDGNIEYYVCDGGENPCGRFFAADPQGTDTVYFNGTAITAREISAADLVIPAAGEHTWELTETIPPADCRLPGTKVYTCTVCGETKEEGYMEEPRPHTFVEGTQVIREPSCEIAGTHISYKYCSSCGMYEYYQTVTDDPLGHSWSEWTVTKAATAVEEGEETRTCSRCGETETRVIPVILQVTRVAPKAAACEETGNSEYYIWNPEGALFPRYFVADPQGTETIYPDGGSLAAREVFRSAVLIPMTGHSWNDGEVTKAASCSEEGVMTFTCTACGAEKTEAIARLAHVPAEEKETEVILEPEGNNPGYHWEITRCSVCGEELERELVEDPAGGSGEDIGTAAQINGVTATFNDRIKLNYYFSLPQELLADDGAYVVLTNESTGKSVTLPVNDAVLVTGRGYKFSIPLVAKEAGDIICAMLYDGGGVPFPIRGESGADYTGTGVRYTIMEYLEWLQTSDNPAESTLAAAAKDYCSAAMIYFDYNTEDAEVSSAVEEVTAEELSGYLAGRAGTLPAGVTVRGISAMLESDNTLRLYLGFKNVAPESFTCTIDGNAAVLKVRSDGAYYLAMDTGVFSNRLQDVHTYTISDGTDTYTISASVLTYARSCAVKSDKVESDLGKALYLYNRAAVAAFGE